MKIVLTDIGKKFNNKWLFRHVNVELESGKSYAIVGPNGSGKSTLLKMLSGYMIPNQGQIEWKAPDSMEPEQLYNKFSFCAPYTDLPEEFTLDEVLNWYYSFKPLFPGLDHNDLILEGKFEADREKTIAQFSSGMKQRLKLLLAFNSNCDLMLLDEPTSNLDASNIQWYKEMIKIMPKKTVVIASNNPFEYDFCEHIIQIERFQ